MVEHLRAARTRQVRPRVEELSKLVADKFSVVKRAGIADKPIPNIFTTAHSRIALHWIVERHKAISRAM